MKVLVVDDHPLVRAGLLSLISMEEHIECIGAAGNCAEALKILKNCKPDIVTVDLRLGDESGFDVIQNIYKVHTDCRFIVLTSSVKASDFRRAKEAGAYGYVLKEALPEELLHAIRLVYNGRRYYDPGMLEIMMNQQESPHQTLLQELTPKEIEVLAKLGMGLSNKEIAKVLFISENTVKKHVSQVLDKLHLTDRTQAALFANAKGLARYEFA
ncbi:response regulator transcription factor [Rossellomorea vietnamensis]|uniref:Response regulator transcription factor n=1 Tax=Rossellomorea vietnamensis TaxID=218284 RepID=A0A5D4M8H5_9BACI|nr:response regulator transcription factor [Rossellomorea vietnamensis]TYR97737.1 response regulator transcription factor [Rossellomorea vietnamensis]